MRCLIWFLCADVPNGTIKPKRAAPVLANSGGQVSLLHPVWFEFRSTRVPFALHRIMVLLLPARPTARRCRAVLGAVALALLRLVAAALVRRLVAVLVGRPVAVLVRRLAVPVHLRLVR